MAWSEGRQPLVRCAAFIKLTEWTLAMTFSGHDDSTMNIVLGLLLLLLLCYDSPQQWLYRQCRWSRPVVHKLLWLRATHINSQKPSGPHNWSSHSFVNIEPGWHCVRNTQKNDCKITWFGFKFMKKFAYCLKSVWRQMILLLLLLNEYY